MTSFTIDCRNLYLNIEKSGTLQAKSGGGYSLNFINPVVIALEGNGARPSHRGSGYAAEGSPSFTLNNVEQHAVAVIYEESNTTRQSSE